MRAASSGCRLCVPGVPIAPLALLLVVLLLLAVPTLALAQTPEKERRFIYGLNLFDGTEYVATFAPHTVDTIYQLAGHVGMLDPKVTEVYFWPITGEVRTDLASLNELVPGQLEVGQGGRVLQTLELTDYVVQIDPAAGLTGGKVFLGAEAHARWTHFQAERAAYLERLRLHTEARLEHNRKLDELRAASAPGAIIALDPPPEPAPFTLYSTEIGRGFPLELPPGEYTIRLREPGGRLVEDSEKRLVVFAPRRAGVGYEVIPQERWTFPEQANEPAEVVYTAPGGVIYLRPHAAHEVNAEAQARLRNPQDLAASSSRWTSWCRAGGRSSASRYRSLLSSRRRVGHSATGWCRSSHPPIHASRRRRTSRRTAWRRRRAEAPSSSAWWTPRTASWPVARARWWSRPACRGGSSGCPSCCR
jgi:hypothetical protein